MGIIFSILNTDPGIINFTNGILECDYLFGEAFKIGFPAVNFFIQHHTVKSFFPINQALADIELEIRSQADGINDLQCGAFCGFNTLGNIDLFFPGEQRNLSHLFKIHPNRIIKHITLIGTGAFFLIFFFFLLEFINLIGVEEFNFKIIENRNYVL